MPHFLDTSVKRLRSLAYIDPERDWIILLITSTIVLAGLIVWNVFVFDRVANGGVIGTIPTVEAPVFSQSSLDAIHTVFEKRAAEELKYTTDGYHYVDPSL